MKIFAVRLIGMISLVLLASWGSVFAQHDDVKLLPQPDRIVALYAHNEGKGTTLYDSSGSHNDAHACTGAGFSDPTPAGAKGWNFGKRSCFELPAALSVSGAESFATYTCMTPALLQRTAGTPNDAWNSAIFPTVFGTNYGQGGADGQPKGLELGFMTSMSQGGYPMKGSSYPFDVAIFDRGLGRGNAPQGLYSTLGMETLSGCGTIVWVVSPAGDQVSINGVPPSLFAGGGKAGASNAGQQQGLRWSEGASQRPESRGLNWWLGTIYLSAVWNTALTLNEQRQVAHAFDQAIAARGIVPPPLHLNNGNSAQPFGNLLVVGESIMQGTFGVPFNRQPSFAHATVLSYSGFSNNNIGTGCWNESAFLAEGNRADGFFDPGARRNVLVVSPNVNSHVSCVHAFGLPVINDPKLAVNLLREYVAARKKAGWTVLIMPAFKAIDPWADAWNTIVGETWQQWSDGFISVILDPALGADNAAAVQRGTVGSYANYTDGVHPGPTYPAMASYVVQYLNLLEGCRFGACASPEVKRGAYAEADGDEVLDVDSTKNGFTVTMPDCTPFLGTKRYIRNRGTANQVKVQGSTVTYANTDPSTCAKDPAANTVKIKCGGFSPFTQPVNGPDTISAGQTGIFRVHAGGLTLKGNSEVFGAHNPLARGIAGGSCTWVRE